ncbi:MAG: hypothetical protein E7674_01795 [Ruminococcaceae bacterium]|nr:hypothetical protein [Oscillospiraceae bacterium]
MKYAARKTRKMILYFFGIFSRLGLSGMGVFTGTGNKVISVFMVKSSIGKYMENGMTICKTHENLEQEYNNTIYIIFQVHFPLFCKIVNYDYVLCKPNYVNYANLPIIWVFFDNGYQYIVRLFFAYTTEHNSHRHFAQ